MNVDTALGVIVNRELNVTLRVQVQLTGSDLAQDKSSTVAQFNVCLHWPSGSWSLRLLIEPLCV